MRLRLLTAVLLMAVPLTPAPAQAPRDLTAQATAMKDIAFLRGRWLGRGHRWMPDGKRVEYTQTMLVEAKSGGILLSIEGLSLRHAEDAGKPGGGSFAVVSYDDRVKRYEFRSFGFGEMITADARLVKPGVFEWLTAGPLMFRFTVDGTVPNEWRETGERSTDGGKTWTPTHALTAWRVDVR
jgi:hypothetical protein